VRRQQVLLTSLFGYLNSVAVLSEVSSLVGIRGANARSTSVFGDVDGFRRMRARPFFERAGGRQAMNVWLGDEPGHVLSQERHRGVVDKLFLRLEVLLAPPPGLDVGGSDIDQAVITPVLVQREVVGVGGEED